MGTSGPRISRPDVLKLAEALGVRWNGLDPMPRLFQLCVDEARRLRLAARDRPSRSSISPIEPPCSAACESCTTDDHCTGSVP
jgi:hypothetical protein